MLFRHGGQAASAVLDWSSPKSMQWPELEKSSGSKSCIKLLQNQSSFPLILAADCIYSPELPKMLAETVVAWLLKDSDARVVVELPRRLGFEQDLKDFQTQMEAVGLVILDEDEETGFDDWGDGRAEDQLVHCWFTVWGWKCKSRDENRSMVRNHYRNTLDEVN
jgi:D-xylulose reductase